MPIQCQTIILINVDLLSIEQISQKIFMKVSKNNEKQNLNKNI